MTKDERKALRDEWSGPVAVGFNHQGVVGFVTTTRKAILALLDALEAAEREVAKYQAMSEADIAERRAAERERDEEVANSKSKWQVIQSYREQLAASESRAATARAEADALRAMAAILQRCAYCEEPGPVNDAEVCPACAAELAESAANPPTPEQEAERKARIGLWFCDEPGCDVLCHDHGGPHSKIIALGDVHRIEWTEPGRYLSALRALVPTEATP